MEEVEQFIDKLPCGEAKNLLVNMLLRVNHLKGSTISPNAAMEGLLQLYDEIVGRSKNKDIYERAYETVHIVCGESPAGSLRVGLGRKHKVIGFPDFFAVGPIWRLETEEGCRHRKKWLGEHLNLEIGDDYYEEEYEGRFLQALAEIVAIPTGVPIVLWSGENADEQTGIRYVMTLLKEKPNDIYLINTTTAYSELFDTEELQHLQYHTAGTNPERARHLFEQKSGVPLSIYRRKQLQREWSLLSQSTGVLRTWESREIKDVDENHYDVLIITSAQELHDVQKDKDYIETGMLIAQIFGNLDGYMTDTFLEYRIRMLVIDGVFDIKGVPKGVHHYRVKLK